MYTLSTSDEEKPDFQPFTLNIRLTTKKTAAKLYEMMEPIIYGMPDGNPMPVTVDGIDKEKRQLAEDICNILSNNIINIKED